MKGSSIILATDLTETAGHAAGWARAFAADQHLPLIVAHVVRISVANWAKGAYDVLQDDELMAQKRQQVVDWYAEHTPDSPEHIEICVGHPHVQLAKLVDTHDAALLVMSASTKGAVQRLVKGSTSQTVAHDPPCPLVLVDPEHVELPSSPRLAVGVDFSQNAERALCCALALAEATGGHLDVVYAGSARDTPADNGGADAQPVRGVGQDAHDEMAALVAKHAESLDAVDFDTHIVEDRPAAGLIDFVDANDIDLLVVGRSGHSKFVANIIGSVLLEVMASRPTTTVIVPARY